MIYIHPAQGVVGTGPCPDPGHPGGSGTGSGSALVLPASSLAHSNWLPGGWSHPVPLADLGQPPCQTTPPLARPLGQGPTSCSDMLVEHWMPVSTGFRSTNCLASSGLGDMSMFSSAWRSEKLHCFPNSLRFLTYTYTISMVPAAAGTEGGGVVRGPSWLLPSPHGPYHRGQLQVPNLVGGRVPNGFIQMLHLCLKK